MRATAQSSILDVADLATFTGGALNFSGGTLNVSGGAHQLPALTDAENTTFFISGGVSLSLPTITSAANASFEVSGGSSLMLAGLTSFTNTLYPTLEATGTGSLLSLPSLASIAVTGGGTNVEAFSGGDLEIPLVTQITGSVDLESNSATSILDVSDLATFTGGTLNFSGGTLNVSGGAHQLPALTDAENTTFLISGGVSLSLPTITSAANASFEVSGGSSLTLSGLTSFTNTLFPTLEATGTGSLLSLPSLTSIAVTSGSTNVEALSGGDLKIPLVTQISGTVDVESENAGSTMDLTDLTTFSGGSLTVKEGGTLDIPALATLVNATLVTDATATFTLPAGQTVSFPSGKTTFTGGTLLDQGALDVQGTSALNSDGGLTVNGQGALSLSSGSTLDVSGNLLGNTTNAAGFTPLGTVVLDSATGTTDPPQQLEVMSQDLGNVAAGFDNNFAYGTLKLTAGTYVELVDDAANSPGNAPEALYVNDLIVPAGATLDLDGLHLYVNTEQINGTVFSGGAVVSGEVYDDANGDGTLDDGEVGLAGWTINLTNTATNSVYTTTTNASGLYSLSGVATGTYTLSEVPQSGFTETQPVSPGTYTLTLSSGQTVTGENFGDDPTATIGGEVFLDTNGDGTLDDSETGLAGWTVQLLNSTSQIIDTTTTAASGTYSFTSLLPGTYTVQVVSQSGYIDSSPANMTIADDNGMSLTVNFGEVKSVSLAVSKLTTTPASGLQSGTSLVVQWTDTNAGTVPASGSFTDQVVITNTTTGDVVATGNVLYNAATLGNLAAGASKTQQYTISLPNGAAGVGQIQFTVTADDEHMVSTSASDPNGTKVLTETSTLPLYPELVPSNITAASSTDPGAQISVGWTLANSGSGAATGPWSEQVFLATDVSGDNPILVAAQSYSGSLGAGQSIARSINVQVPDSLAPGTTGSSSPKTRPARSSKPTPPAARRSRPMPRASRAGWSSRWPAAPKAMPPVPTRPWPR